MNPIPNEANLVQLAQAGDNAAFNTLFEYYKSHVYQYAIQVLGDADVAEDAVQTTLIYCWKKISGGEFVYHPGKLSHWMMATCKNMNRNVQEGRKLEDALWYRLKREERGDPTIWDADDIYVELPEPVLPPKQPPETLPSPIPRKRYRTPKVQLEIYRLHQIGHTNREIANMLSIKPTTVRTSLYKIRKKLEKRSP